MKVKSIVGNVRTAGADLASQLLRPAPLAVALSCVVMPISTAHAAYDSKSTAIGDLSIYKPAQEGGANVMMMLDVSGSMGMIKQIGYDSGGNAFDYAFVDSISNDYEYSCVSSGETKRRYYSDGYNTYYEDVKPWHDNHGLGLFDESITIEGETLTYKLQGCTNGSFVVEPDRKECTTKEVDETADYKGFVGIKTDTYRFEVNLNNNVGFIKDPTGEYFYYDRYYDSRYGYYYTFLSVKDFGYFEPDGATRYRLAGKTEQEVCEVVPGGTKWTLTNPDDWKLNPVGESKPDSRWEGKPGVSLGGERLDRLSRLKRALIQSLGTYSADEIAKLPAGSRSGYGVAPDGRQVTAGDYKIASNSLVGLGQFSADETASYRDGTTGQILVAAQELTPEHRKKLIKTISGFFAAGGTPAANAYAEAGAYMLGNSTKGYGSISGFSNPVSPYETNSNIKTYSSYNEPGTDDKYQCYGKGIYFLTDGAPNTANATYTKRMMAQTLGISYTDLSAYSPLPTTGVEFAGSGWGDIGNYAQALRNRSDRYKDIRTATVGFGRSFTALKDYKIPITSKTGATEKVINCQAEDENISQDARNLCNWGSKENYTAVNGLYSVRKTDEKWGGGGFTAAENSDEIAESLLAFIGNFDNLSESAPGGTITVPNDPYRGGNITPYAYLPMLKPEAASNKSTWQGNVKKYETRNATLYGKNNERLYTPLKSNSRGGELRKEAADLWSKTTGGDNSDITSGGFYALLQAPDSADIASTRNVFVESHGTGATNGVTNIGVTSAGKLQGFTPLTDAVYGDNDAERGRSYRTLLNFLGYEINPNDTTPSIADLDMKNHIPLDKVRNLGGVIHSNPALVSFSADVDSVGRVETDESKRNEYLLFGSMDGALHLVDATTGQEKWSLILKEMFRKQPNALVKDSTGSLKFGVDAPWLVNANYRYKDATGSAVAKVTLDTKANHPNVTNFLPIAAYGGFRMGGRGLYAIVPKESAPKIKFSITPDTTSNDPVWHKADGTTVAATGTVKEPGYGNIGQIWSKVTMGRVVQGSSKTKSQNVIIFGGGYDERYEDPTFVPSTDWKSNPTQGSSIYIVDAATGKRKWSWRNELNHSIVGGITALDKDADGLFDYLYFADLGGNVFRAAFVNKLGTDFKNASVTRVFAASDKLPTTKKSLAYRFYNAPVVSFYDDEDTGNVFAVINVASGNRSSPLSKERNDNQYANRVYGIIDREIATEDLLTADSTGSYISGNMLNKTEDDLVMFSASKLQSATESTNNLRVSKLCEPVLDASGNAIITDGALTYSSLCKKKVGMISEIIDGKKDGWYYPLIRFDGYTNVKNVKAFGDYRVLGSTLYMSAYESDLSYEDIDPCDGSIKGVTENQEYCLPYGVCMHDSSKSGTGGFSPVGKGLQELTFGALNSDNTDISVLLGTSTLGESQSVRVDTGDDSNKGNVEVEKCKDPSCVSNWNEAITSGSASSSPYYIPGDHSASDGFDFMRFVLTPEKWYELTEKAD